VPEAGAVLEAKGVCKSFDGNVVLSNVDLAIRPGEIHAVVGENGAGKSTLIKVLGGIHRPDRGALLVGGIPRRLHSPGDALAHGIVVIHQELSLAPHLSSEQNIFLGHFPVTRFGLVDRREIRRRTEALFDRLSIDVDPGLPVGQLGVAQQQMVEIAKALSFDARVLILDEPSAVLDDERLQTLFGVIRRLRAEGLGLVYISHHLDEIFSVADCVTVLRDGRRTGHAAVADVTEDWMVGRMIGRDFASSALQSRRWGRTAIEISKLSRAGQFDDVSFSVREGEVVGLAGLVGAGRSEVAQAIIGALRPDRGSIAVFGKDVRISGPDVASRLGLAYVTEDRKTCGLLANRPVRENLTISNLRRFSRFRFLRPRRERSFARDMIARLDIRLPGMDHEIRKLSGGNQQKVLIGRALAVRPRILILDEPTRGVDIGAKQEIYAIIERLLAERVAVILISSELEEVLRLSDQILVLRRGKVAATLSREHASEAAIMRAAAIGS